VGYKVKRSPNYVINAYVYASKMFCFLAEAIPRFIAWTKPDGYWKLRFYP
jgi:hypothetical protein